MPRAPHTPVYRLHRPSGRAVVTLGGRDFYLGPWNSPESHAEYNRLLAEYYANGNRPPGSSAASHTVAEIVRAFWRHAKVYYRHGDGSPTGEVANYRDALRPLVQLYANTPASEFGPLALKAVRESMLRPRTVTAPKTGKPRQLRGWSRAVANRQTARIKHVFKWATENELIPPAVYQGLMALSGLRKGRSDARECPPVRPVPQEHVDAVLPLLSRQVPAMIQLQLLTGMRPGEVCLIRGCDLETPATGNWAYRPHRHKTEHLDLDREVFLGPKAKELLATFFKPDLTAYLFSPADAEAERLDARRAARATPMTPSHHARSERARERRRRRPPEDVYDVKAYRRAIARACERAGVPSWHPHQLRHNAATRYRRERGIEVARVLLGHRSAVTTAIYAEADRVAASKVMLEVG